MPCDVSLTWVLTCAALCQPELPSSRKSTDDISFTGIRVAHEVLLQDGNKISFGHRVMLAPLVQICE